MPIFNVMRNIEYTAAIEAPTEELAIAAAKTWTDGDWGTPNEDEVVGLGISSAVRPDYTVNLQGQEHEHCFDDEDTGGCIYCDAMPPTQEATK